LVAVALRGVTDASRAVQAAALAFSLLHRDGYNYEANQYKIKAIAHLRASIQDGSLDELKILQHVAAGMLLCHFEVSLSTLALPLTHLHLDLYNY
jgi:hypothetical protein